jgi:hypothetical protein
LGNDTLNEGAVPMGPNPPTDAEAFLSFLTYEVKNGGAEKSPEELLHVWRREHAAAIEDIRHGVHEFEAGNFRPFDEVSACNQRSCPR